MTEQALRPPQVTLEERYRVQSVERAFQLLEALAAAGTDGSTLSDLARSIGVSKSTAYAILQTLLGGGFVADMRAGSTRRYRLGMALARLGDVVVSQIALRDVALPVLRELAGETRLTARVAVLDDPYAVVIARVDAPDSSVRFAANLGKREHLHCSAVGKAMLAALDRDRRGRSLPPPGCPARHRTRSPTRKPFSPSSTTVEERGYAVDDEEDVEGVFCVGVAVHDHTARCVGAISVTGIKRDLPAWQVVLLGTKVREHAVRISELLGAPRVSRRGASSSSARRDSASKCYRSCAPGPSEVLLRPAYCGLCGTDLELAAGEVDPAFVRYPLVLGHEWSGVVAAVGEGVAGLEPGMRCVAEGIIPCGNCAECRRRRHQRMRDLRRSRLHAAWRAPPTKSSCRPVSCTGSSMTSRSVTRR